MPKIEMQINGRKIASNAQLRSEMNRLQKNFEVGMKKSFEDRLKKAAGPSVQLKKTKEGYMLQGTPEQIERTKKRLR